MRELEPCPTCGSGDVGGASGIVHCYRCKAEMRAATTPEAAERWNIRAVFIRHGFIIPTDSEAIYRAARALLEHDRERRGNPGEDAMQTAARDLPDGYELRVCLERGAGWVEFYAPDGEAVDLADDTDDGMTGRIRSATQAAIEHAKERT
ncbi:hypothetical protein Bcep1808_7681 (plasmid) [Burkholderia vietnamiensis G4]|uniref:Uncharacterized protein n=1 Tax=Burkholderia vietnamiensis (strain G4 / LMG 22486) TaxID=269482 RepID=A4JW98_BURVG|nr:hypothetical protein Bcep1808_7681 [Burkholderia vietnamiensis G4]